MLTYFSSAAAPSPRTCSSESRRRCHFGCIDQLAFISEGSQLRLSPRASPAMALLHCSTSAVKAVVLPLLMLMAIAAAPSICAAQQNDAAVAESVVEGGGGFPETPLGRKLLNFNFCGSGTAPNFNCAAILPFAQKPACCTDLLGIKACWDVGAFLLDKCGSCTTKCSFPQLCCSGVCANLQTDKNNCGFCGHKCKGPCVRGFCNY